MKIQKDNFTTKKILLVSLAAVLLVIAGLFYAFYPTKDTTPDNESSEIAEDSEINFDPPTEQEIKDSQNAKERIFEGDSTTDSDTGQSTGSNDTSIAKKPVTVGVSYAGVINNQLEIRAFTSSVISGTGECTAIISKSGSETITKVSPAFIDASSTICEPIYIPKSNLSAGAWLVNVTFSSPTHEGKSGPIEVEVN